MKYEIVPTQWPETFRVQDETGYMVGQGDKTFCDEQKKQYELSDANPPCACCGHKMLYHFCGGSTRLRTFEAATDTSYEIDACDWDTGWSGSEWCKCTGYCRTLPEKIVVVTKNKVNWLMRWLTKERER